MAITVAELIRRLQTKVQSDEVEFIVCKTDGELVCADIEKQAKAMAKLLKMFGGH